MDNKALFCVLLAFLFFFVLFQNGLFVDSNDNAEHKEMGKVPGYNLDYAPLLRSFSGWFAWSSQYWFALILFLFAVITPLLLFQITRNWLAVPFYFFITNYFYAIVGAGLYAQGLVIIFLLALFCTKNNYVRLVLVFVGSLSHSTAPLLLVIGLILILFEENYKEWYCGLYDKVLLGCSPIFGMNTPQVLKTSLASVPGKAWSLSLGGLIGFFVKTCPLPFLFAAIIEWVKEKRISFLLLCGIAFVLSFFWNSRILLLIAPFMVIGFTNYFETLKHKKLWSIIIIIFGLFNFQQYLWVVLEVGC
jgi:hypothetical protein